MVVSDYLHFTGLIRGMSKSAVRQRLPEVLDVTNLTDVQHELIRNLSHGYRQRVGMAQAIVHKPRLLILDEPTRGLDPVQIVEMRHMIRALKKAHTILISSHILPEISETCDRLLVLGEGNIVGAGTEAQLSTDLVAGRRVVVGVTPKDGATASDVAQCLRAIPSVNEVGAAHDEDGHFTFEVGAGDDVRAAVCRALVGSGHGVVKLDLAHHKLESVFLKLVKPGGSSARN